MPQYVDSRGFSDRHFGHFISASPVHLETWVHVNFLVRLMALFMLPKRMGVESGGFRGVLPRKIGRQAVNKLLQKLAQPPVD